MDKIVFWKTGKENFRKSSPLLPAKKLFALVEYCCRNFYVLPWFQKLLSATIPQPLLPILLFHQPICSAMLMTKMPLIFFNKKINPINREGNNCNPNSYREWFVRGNRNKQINQLTPKEKGLDRNPAPLYPIFYEKPFIRRWVK